MLMLKSEVVSEKVENLGLQRSRENKKGNKTLQNAKQMLGTLEICHIILEKCKAAEMRRPKPRTTRVSFMTR